MISESVTKLIDEFAKLPGIGKKSAERLAYHVLRVHPSEALALADAIRGVKENVRYCRTCYNLTEEEECEICRDPKRDRTLLCVVEQPRDVIALEQPASCRLVHIDAAFDDLCRATGRRHRVIKSVAAVEREQREGEGH